MNEIVNKLLLEGDTFMPDMNLRQPGITYNAPVPSTKNKERIKKLKETGDSKTKRNSLFSTSHNLWRF